MHHIYKLLALAIVLTTITSSVHAGEPKDLEVKLVCDFDRALEAGHYDWTHVAYEDITVPDAECKEKKKVTLSFIQINEEVIALHEAIEEMKNRGCRPATWPELFALGADHPEMQRDKHIVALGSIWTYTPKDPRLKKRVQTMVSYLDADTVDGRNLGFDNALGWNNTVHFLAVCS